MSFHKIHLVVIITFVIASMIILFASHSGTCSGIPQYIYNPALVQKNLIVSFINQYNPYLSLSQKQLISTEIINQSLQNGFDPFLITSIIAAESSFTPSAISPCQAQGLMQITSGVARGMKVNDPFDIKQNISAGTRYLKALQHQFGRKELFLAAYNAGPTRVARLGRVPNIKETLNYIKQIFKYHTGLSQQFLTTLNCLFVKPVLYPTLLVASSELLVNHSIAAQPFMIFLPAFDLCDNRSLWLLLPC